MTDKNILQIAANLLLLLKEEVKEGEAPSPERVDALLKGIKGVAHSDPDSVEEAHRRAQDLLDRLGRR